MPGSLVEDAMPDAVRAVDVHPGDGVRALADMSAQGVRLLPSGLALAA